jgi:hypothetical protein
VKCDHCEKKDNIKEKPELKIILKWQADKIMEISKNRNKNKGQTR